MANLANTEFAAKAVITKVVKKNNFIIMILTAIATGIVIEIVIMIATRIVI